MSTADHTTSCRCTVLLDVDNTLLDNDRAKAALRDRLRTELGPAADGRFWETYEAIRAERGVVDIPRTLARFAAAEPGLIAPAALSAMFTALPYASYLFPESLAVLAALRAAGHRPVILSDGDPIFQTHKIWRAGLTTAVDGAVAVVPDKRRELEAIVAYYPAEAVVVVDDKPGILAAARTKLPGAITVHVARGHYGAGLDAAQLAGVDLRLPGIGELPAALAEFLTTHCVATIEDAR